MKINLRLLISIGALLLAGCGGGNAERQSASRVTLTAVYGSTLDGVQLTPGGNSVRLVFGSLPAEGRLLRLNLPEGAAAVHEQWSAATGTIHLVQPVAQGAEIGVVPTGAYHGETVELQLSVVAAPRAASIVPTGQANVITDLQVTSPSSGFATLDWTQRNAGDYNFDGEVNISDLTPLAPRLNQLVDRTQPGAELQTAYWVDGDANGQINIADITPIGGRYGAQVAGYNIYRNDVLIAGQNPGEPTVLLAEAVERPGLPNQFHVTEIGFVNDTWVVKVVDFAGNEGADSAGDPGPIDLNASLNVIGLDLLDLSTGQPGAFGPGKMSTRVIDPGDIVDRTPIGNTVTNGTASVVRNLPRSKVLMVDFRFAPTINLATGAPKGGSSFKGASAVADDDIISTSVIFKLPEGTEPAHIDATIEAVTNPDGGYFLDLTADLDIPGDNPDTAAIEPGFVDTQHTRIDFAHGTVSRDTNGNGWDDNPHVEDPDHDGVGENERHRFDEFDDDNHREDEVETEIVATIQSINVLAGTITLTGIADNGEGALPYSGSATATFDFTELSEFIERNDQFKNGVLTDPALFAAGEEVEVDMYPALGGGYWIEKVKRDLRT